MHINSPVFFVIFLAAIILINVRNLSRWRGLRSPRASLTDNGNSESDSEIISFYSAGHELSNAGSGELNGMRYNIYASAPMMPTENSMATGMSKMLTRNPNDYEDRPIEYTNSMAVIFALDLPFNTQSHFVGLSTEHKIDRLVFAKFMQTNGLVKVVLEGDFRDYFDIYAAAGQDVQVRTILNPEAMGFVVDYCRTHFWEINNSTLYFVGTGADKGSDDIISDSQKFVQQIKPALIPGDPGAASVQHENPYGEYDGPPLPCPICQKPMVITDNWMARQDGHGALLNGADLTKLHNHGLTIAADATKSQQHGPLACPNDHSQMEPVNYEETGAQINSCPTCPFRWLDAAAIVKLNTLPPQPETNPLEN